MGSDSRDCEGCDIDQEGGGGSDTTILVHLSADRSRAYAVSIPRDSIVDRPEDGCDAPAAHRRDVERRLQQRRSGVHAAHSSRQNTGIRVEHFVVVDFGSFGNMVDAVGGVPVCVPEDIKDPAHGIFVPKGNPSMLTRRRGPRLRPRALRRRQDPAERHLPHPPPAGVHRRARAQGAVGRHPDPPRQGREVPQRRHPVADHRRGVRLRHAHRQGRACSCRASASTRSSSSPCRRTTTPSDSEFSGKVFWTDQADQIWDLINHDKELPAKLIEGHLDQRRGPAGLVETPSPRQQRVDVRQRVALGDPERDRHRDAVGDAEQHAERPGDDGPGGPDLRSLCMNADPARAPTPRSPSRSGSAAGGWPRPSVTACRSRPATTPTPARTPPARVTTGTATRCRRTTADLRPRLPDYHQAAGDRQE